MKRTMGSRLGWLCMAAAIFVAAALLTGVSAAGSDTLAPHEERACPVCGEEMRFVSEGYDPWVNTGGNRWCVHDIAGSYINI